MAHASPFVSVIIPCYNQGAVLHEAIDSAIAQTHTDCEVIVVDDGSTDCTPAVAATYGAAIRYVHQSNRGLSAARNAGIAAARGSIIGLLDADDRWLPHKLATELPLFAAREVGVVHGSYRKFPVEHPKAGVVRKHETSRTTYHQILAFNIVGAPVSALFRRDACAQVGGFDETLRGAEDWDLWIRLAARCEFAGSRPITAEYRLSAGSMSRNYRVMYSCLNQVIEKNRGRHGTCGECRAAVRRARQHARSYYCEAAAVDAFEQRRAGHPIRYARLRLNGICRNPGALMRIVPAIGRRIALRLH